MQISSEKTGDDRTFAVIGAAMEVHRTLGSGFLEVFYRDALAIEFGLRAIPFEPEVPCSVVYKGHQLRGHYRMDFVCFGAVVIEVKARSGVGAAEHAQVLSYLASTEHQCGLLLNFGASKLEYRRFILTKPPQTGDAQELICPQAFDLYLICVICGPGIYLCVICGPYRKSSNLSSTYFSPQYSFSSTVYAISTPARCAVNRSSRSAAFH